MSEDVLKRKLLIVEDNQPLRESCVRLFERRQYEVFATSNGQQALEQLTLRTDIGVVLADLKMPGMDGIELLQKIRARAPSTQVIIMTAYGTIKTAVEAVKLGAADYVTKPFDPEELVRTIDRAHEIVSLRTQVQNLSRELQDSRVSMRMIGSSPAMQAVHKNIRIAAKGPSPVLIYGETGTGKELVARAIHDASGRAEGPFVAINCAAFARDLIDRELFGHTKGAFTGADSDQPGLFAEARDGTLFLDEIPEMPPPAQAKLLRALQDGRIRPLGSTKEIEAKPRIVSATNRLPLAAVEEGLLRQDLYYRLRVFEIQVPPLRKRLEDIPVLSQHFIQQANRKLGRDIEGICDRALRILMSHNWPGNVRELENILESAVASTATKRIEISSLESLLQPRFQAIGGDEEFRGGVPTLDAMARSLATRAVREFHGNKTQAACALGISRNKLYELLAGAPTSRASQPEP